MRVSSISVTRERKVQPEQYGSAGASLTVVADMDEGDNWEEAARNLLEGTRGLVYENLGLKLPAKAKAAPKEETKVETTEDAGVPDEDDKKDAKADKKDAKTTTGKKRGRPPKNKKSEEVKDDDGMPDDDEPQIRTNPENRVNPEDDDDGVPDDDSTVSPDSVEGIPDDDEEEPTGSETEYTAQDLQSFLTTMVKDKKITAQRVREIVASKGAARTTDLSPEQIIEVRDEIRAEAK